MNAWTHLWVAEWIPNGSNPFSMDMWPAEPQDLCVCVWVRCELNSEKKQYPSIFVRDSSVPHFYPSVAMTQWTTVCVKKKSPPPTPVTERYIFTRHQGAPVCPVKVRRAALRKHFMIALILIPPRCISPPPLCPMISPWESVSSQRWTSWSLWSRLALIQRMIALAAGGPSFECTDGASHCCYYCYYCCWYCSPSLKVISQDAVWNLTIDVWWVVYFSHQLVFISYWGGWGPHQANLLNQLSDQRHHGDCVWHLSRTFVMNPKLCVLDFGLFSFSLFFLYPFFF